MSVLHRMLESWGMAGRFNSMRSTFTPGSSRGGMAGRFNTMRSTFTPGRQLANDMWILQSVS